MKSPTGFLVLASSIFLTMVPARRLAGQADRPAEGHWYCVSAYEDNPVYVTGVWDGTAAMDDVESAFAQQLSTKYGYKGRVSCSRANMSGSVPRKRVALGSASSVRHSNDHRPGQVLPGVIPALPSK